LRSQPLNEISALMSGSQVQGPQFNNVPQVGVQPADYTSAANLAYQGKMAQYNAQQQANQGLMGGLFGLAGTIGGSVAGGPMGAQLGNFLGRKAGGWFGGG